MAKNNKYCAIFMCLQLRIRGRGHCAASETIDADGQSANRPKPRNAEGKKTITTSKNRCEVTWKPYMIILYHMWKKRKEVRRRKIKHAKRSKRSQNIVCVCVLFRGELITIQRLSFAQFLNKSCLCVFIQCVPEFMEHKLRIFILFGARL